MFESFSLSLGESAGTLNFRQACVAANVLARNVRRSRAKYADRPTPTPGSFARPQSAATGERYVLHQRSIYIGVMQRLWIRILALLKQELEAKTAVPRQDKAATGSESADGRVVYAQSQDSLGDGHDLINLQGSIDSRQMALALKALATSRPLAGDGGAKQLPASKAHSGGGAEHAKQTSELDRDHVHDQHGESFEGAKEYSALEWEVYDAAMVWILQSDESGWDVQVPSVLLFGHGAIA
jgi:hypothetical protein